MIESPFSSKFKMAAIDLDGTLLAPDGTITPANQKAVQRLQQAGLHVVLASGRHYNSMRPYAAALPGVQWLVSSQGGELSDLRRTVVMTSQYFLPPADVANLVQTGQILRLSPVAFGTDGVFTTVSARNNPDLEFFTNLDGHPPIRCELAQLFSRSIFKVIWVGNPSAIAANLQAAADTLAALSEIQIVQTDRRFLEFMPAAMSKASALKILADRLQLKAAETIAFGDGDNDVPMFEWAGLSVAMPHGWPAALRAASHTAPAGPMETALARGVDLLFAQGHLTIPSKHNPPRSPATIICG